MNMIHDQVTTLSLSSAYRKHWTRDLGDSVCTVSSFLVVVRCNSDVSLRKDTKTHLNPSSSLSRISRLFEQIERETHCKYGNFSCYSFSFCIMYRISLLSSCPLVVVLHLWCYVFISAFSCFSSPLKTILPVFPPIPTLIKWADYTSLLVISHWVKWKWK